MSATPSNTLTIQLVRDDDGDNPMAVDVASGLFGYTCYPIASDWYGFVSSNEELRTAKYGDWLVFGRGPVVQVFTPEEYAKTRP